MSKRFALAVAVALIAPIVAALQMAAPAQACTDSDDANTLCSNEQAFVNDLAAVGITATSTPRVMVSQAISFAATCTEGCPAAW